MRIALVRDDTGLSDRWAAVDVSEAHVPNSVLITLTGWFFLALGLFRMFAAGLYRRGSANTGASVFMVLEAILVAIGLIITFKPYSRSHG